MARRFVLIFSLLLTAASYVAVASPAHAALGLRETPDQTWMTNGIVYASDLSADGKTLYIGGKFSSVREKPAGTTGKTLAVNNVAAINVATGTAISTWRPNVAGDANVAAEVRALEVRNGKVYIGGKFTAVNGQPRRNLAAVDAGSGAVGAFSSTVGTDTSVVYTLASDASRLYIGGKFQAVNGVGRGNLAAVNPTSGAVDTVWKPRANELVRELQFDASGGTIFAAGRFDSVSSNGTTAGRQSVARFSTATGNVTPWAIPTGTIDNPMTAWDITVTPTRLFGSFGLGPNYSAAFRLDNGDTGNQVWRYGLVGNPQTSTISPDGTRLIVGGHFGINPLDQQVCGGRYLKGIVALNPANGAVDCSWIPTLDQRTRPSYDGAWTMQTIGDYVWVGGRFISVSGVKQSNLARFTYDPNFRPINYSTPKVDLDGLQRGGLDATFYDNIDFTGSQVSRTDPTIDVDWGDGSPDQGIGPDTFSARWSGRVEAPVSGEYTFTTTADDGVRLFVDGKQLIDNWSDRAPTDDSGTITLEAGKRYDVQMDYYENGGGAVAKLQWSYPGQVREAVPAANLFFSGETGYTTTFAPGAGPTAINDQNNLAVTDADDANIRSATVTLTDRPDGTAEKLSADTAGTVVVQSYDAQTGTLSLNGTTTKSVFEKILKSVRYNNTSASPSSGDRRVTFVVNDGFVNSDPTTSTVGVQGP